MPKQSNPVGILNRNPYDNHTGWHDGGQNFGCVDRRTYDLANVQPRQVIKAAEWEKLRQTLNYEESRRAKTFENSGSRSSYYGSSFFTTLRRQIGQVIKASEFNDLTTITRNLGTECACDCAYCTCNCNYCTCNCAYCTCNCNHCTCNCAHDCTCESNY